jgi:MYXO-CTERM domain-containing protein
LLTAAAVAIGILIYLIADRTNWSGGLGFDGYFYGELAKNFPSAVFNHGHVVAPGFGPSGGPELNGVDSYYIYRIVPSGIVWLGLKVLMLSPTDGHVVGLFSGLNTLMFGLATWCWCRSAALLGLGDREKLLGATALLINFGVLRTGSWLPVLTDQSALGLGALSFYLWLRGQTIALAVVTFLTCFTWPLQFLVGGILLLLPPNLHDFGEEAKPRSVRRHLTPLRLALGGVAGLATIVALVVLQVGGRVSIEGTEQLPVFPLSVAITGAFVFAVIGCFAPEKLAVLWRIVKSIQLPRLALAVGVIVVARVIGGLLATRAGYNGSEILKEEFWWTTLDPGIFIVILVSYLGPLMLALLGDLPRAAANCWRLGPGMAAVVVVGLLGALTVQPREIVDVVPFMILPGVLAVRRLFGLSNLVLAAFLVISLAFSRIWLHIGALSTDFAQLQNFPAQKYYMALGPWTPPSTYAMQLGGALATLAVAGFFLLRRRRQGVDPTVTPQTSTPDPSA